MNGIFYYKTPDQKTFYKYIEGGKMTKRFTSNAVELGESKNDCPFKVDFVASKWVFWQKNLIPITKQEYSEAYEKFMKDFDNFDYPKP